MLTTWDACYAPVATPVGGRGTAPTPCAAPPPAPPPAALALAARPAAARNTVETTAGGSKIAAPTIQPTRISLNCTET